ncbi:MAG TPA: ATP-binding protein [Vicinamibacterales bacterium]|nr:ATP-binding protein [Vicinamibacterales bacterium]
MADDDAETPRPERQQTDKSLRTEREKTDRALAQKQAAVEEDADTVIARARETADAVLEEARDKADDHLEETSAVAETRGALDDERAREDKAVSDERAAADASLAKEREESNRALARLLPLERVKTDRFLLTERVRSDDALSHRDDFLGIVSHDLRNLLGGIVMSAGILAQTKVQGVDAEHITAGTDRIQRYAARMNRLIGDLLDVASIDAGRLATTAAPGSVAAVVDEAVEIFSADAAAKGLTLDAGVTDPALTAAFDHDRVLQVLANLLSNAIKFTGKGGSVHVEAARTGGDVRISITDTGAGIPESMLDVVFQRFWQAGTDDRRGLGLGLYISRSIVEAHGGRIWVESTPEAGSTFFFTLPAA